MTKVTIECKVIVEIEFEDKYDDNHIKFYVEENHCPGTGSMGMKIEEAMEIGEKQQTCWACALQGENKILKIERNK